jgi:hypothetical protein
MALPSGFTVASAVVVAAAAVGLVLTSGSANAGTPDRSPTHSATATSRPGSSSTGHSSRAHAGSNHHRSVRHVAPKAPVAVYNNAGIRGLAAEKADMLQGAGWDVAAVANWYGNIPANTVYYPPGLRPAAHRLAAVLGVQRLRPAVAPMQLDRLTVIFTSQ